MITTINTLEDVLSILRSGDDEATYALSEEFKTLKIKVGGERYHSSIPAELARGLWQFQEALYKAVAFSIHGVEDIRKLTTEQREDFELNFKVQEGSTEILASIGKFIEKLGDGISTMSSKDKKQTILLISALLAGAFLTNSYLNHDAEVTKVKADVQKVRLGKEEHENTIQAFASLVGDNDKARAFQKAVEEGGQAVVKGADDATSVEVPGKKYTRNDIEDLTQRAPREPAKSESDIRKYKIVTINTKSADIIKLGLVDVASDDEIPVNFIRDDMTMDDINAIWAAAKSGDEITLEVSKNYRKDTLVLATILSVRRPEAAAIQVAEKK